jgi:hypothetical protein
MARPSTRISRLRGLVLLRQLLREGSLSVLTFDGDRLVMLTRLLPDGNVIHKLQPDAVGSPLWHTHIQAVTERVAALTTLLAGLERTLQVRAVVHHRASWLVLGVGGALLGVMKGMVLASIALLVGAVLLALARYGLRLGATRIAQRLLGETPRAPRALGG